MTTDKIKSYQDLIVWQKSKDFVLLIYKATEKFPDDERYGLTSQLRRAAISVPSNIAEGFRRGTKKEKLQFLRIAYGSGAEIETQLVIAKELEYINSDDYLKLVESLEEIMKILNTLIGKFKKSGMKKRILKTTHYILPTIVVLLTTHYILPTSHAQSIGFSLAENIFDLEIPAGSSYKGKAIVINNPKSLVTPIHVELNLWDLSEETDDLEFVTSEPALNATRWFTFEDGRDYILEAGEDREIYFRVDVPGDTPPGSYLVTMRFQSVLPEYYFNADGPRFIPEIATIFFIKVPIFTLDGDRSGYGADIVSLEPEGDKIPFVDNFLPRANAGVFDSAVKDLLADIRNDGIFHFKMSGNVEIKNIFGRTIVDAPLPQRYLLPNRTREVDIAVLPPPETENLPFIQRVFKSITYNLKTNTYLGPYSATVLLEIPDEPPVVESANFWVIPWQFWLIVGFIILGLLFISRRFGRELTSRFGLFVKILRGRIKPNE